jgi:hypothetical protein
MEVIGFLYVSLGSSTVQLHDGLGSTGFRGAVELKLMRELARRQRNQSKKAEIVNYYYQWQILKPSGKRKAKRSFRVSVKTPKGIEEKVTFERY